MMKFTIKPLLALMFFISGASAEAQSVLKDHDTYQPLDITAERLEMKQKQGRAIFKGAVKVVQGNMVLSSETLTVFYKAAEGEEKPAISRLDALGTVTLVSTTESLSGDWGVYDVDRRLITIGGNVIFKQGDNILKGERLEFDLVSGLAKLDGQKNAADDGRVRGTFSVPKKEEPSKN
jgi:lipopolysaccharide export system protein LptA